MEVAGVAGDAEKILEQIVMERLLDAVSSELRAWLKEQKPATAEDLGNLSKPTCTSEERTTRRR